MESREAIRFGVDWANGETDPATGVEQDEQTLPGHGYIPDPGPDPGPTPHPPRRHGPPKNRMPKNQSAWGIEIGAFAIKAILLEREGSEVLVKDFAYLPHAKPLTTPEIDVTEVTRLTLQQFVASKNLEEAPVVVSVPGHEIGRAHV